MQFFFVYATFRRRQQIFRSSVSRRLLPDCQILFMLTHTDPFCLVFTGLNCAFQNVICCLEWFMRERIKLQDHKTDSEDHKSSVTSYSFFFAAHTKQLSAFFLLVSKHVLWPLRWEAARVRRVQGGNYEEQSSTGGEKSKRSQEEGMCDGCVESYIKHLLDHSHTLERSTTGRRGRKSEKWKKKERRRRKGGGPWWLGSVSLYFDSGRLGREWRRRN